MKLNLIGSLSLVSFLFTAPAPMLNLDLKANVPFTFNVGNTQLPAGHYTISIDCLSNRITVQSWATTATVISHGQQDYPGKKSDTLVFRQAGDQYFLTEVWGEQGSEGMKLRGPKRYPRLRSQVSRPTPATK